MPIVVCGAGIAGIAAAWFLAVRCGLRNVTLVDERRPLSLTSDKSTEAYRNWWPGPDDAMVRLMNRSIDLLEELAQTRANPFMLNRRGYFYATTRPERAASLHSEALLAEQMGAGSLRVHTTNRDGYLGAPYVGFVGQPDGADLLLGRTQIEHHFPWLAPDIIAVLHARRCGWFSGQQLGMLLLNEARAAGVRLVNARVAAIERAAGAITGVTIVANDGAITLPAEAFVNAAGPLARSVASMLDVDLPLFSERHLKIAFDDRLGVVPRGAGLVICEDPVTLDWSEDERTELACNDATRWLVEALPPGVHLRPEGHSAESQTVLLLWAYHTAPCPETLPVPLDSDFGEIALRGMAHLIPGLQPYTRRLPKSYMDGGYYTKTVENRPLIGPLSVPGAFVIAGLSGFGLMAACAAAELLAAHLCGAPLPAYAPAFHPARFANPAYLAHMAQWGSTGQL
jgi:glycine/D-amino acid oxidase-like deaminating enzyme